VGASALLVLSVALSVSLDQLRPMVRELQRETATDRTAVRELAVNLARAVRRLVGSQSLRAYAAPRPSPEYGAAAASGSTRRASVLDETGPVHRPRVQLLDLPPPVSA
jgi:hypothetical protein